MKTQAIIYAAALAVQLAALAVALNPAKRGGPKTISAARLERRRRRYDRDADALEYPARRLRIARTVYPDNPLPLDQWQRRLNNGRPASPRVVHYEIEPVETTTRPPAAMRFAAAWQRFKNSIAKHYAK